MKYLIFILGTIVLLGCTREVNRKENFQEVYLNCHDIQCIPEEYPELYDCYQANEYLFPPSGTKKYVFYQNIDTEYGETYQEIGSGSEPEVFNGFRKMLSDSSNFRWGETGTQWITHKIDFIDAKNEIIARIAITSAGNIGTTPYYKIEKWGSLTDEGYDGLTRLIEMMKD